MATLRDGGMDMSAGRSEEGSAVTTSSWDQAALPGAWIRVSAAARRMGASERRVRRMLARRSLFGLKDSRGWWRIPIIQFAGPQPIRGLSTILRAMPEDLESLEIWMWLSHPEPDLELHGRAVSPLTWLRSGRSPARAAHLAADL